MMARRGQAIAASPAINTTAQVEGNGFLFAIAPGLTRAGSN